MTVLVDVIDSFLSRIVNSGLVTTLYNLLSMLEKEVAPFFVNYISFSKNTSNF